MNWNLWIRKSHRWVSIFFTLTVAANFIAMAMSQTMMWLTYLPLAPLFYMLISGLYLFARPYFSRQNPDTGKPI